MKYILQRDASVAAVIRGKHYRKSLLIQRGLEVPCEISVKMSTIVIKHAMLQRYGK